jgi:branched-subunit amino acid ABC-type transport system permease component
LYLLIQKTRLGLAMKAASESLTAAQTPGIPTHTILAAFWGLTVPPGVIAEDAGTAGMRKTPVYEKRLSLTLVFFYTNILHVSYSRNH